MTGGYWAREGDTRHHDDVTCFPSHRSSRCKNKLTVTAASWHFSGSALCPCEGNSTLTPLPQASRTSQELVENTRDTVWPLLLYNSWKWRPGTANPTQDRGVSYTLPGECATL